MFVLGTAQLGGAYGVLNTSVEQSEHDVDSFLRTARVAGFSAVDTAPAYPRAEEMIGNSNVSFKIHTKLGSKDPRVSFEGSLRRLRVESVEIAYLHDPDVVLVDPPAVEVASAIVAGRADRLGASIYSIDALIAAYGNRHIGAVQLPLNPLFQSVSRAALVHRRAGCLTFGRSLLAQGLIATPASAIPARVKHLSSTIERFHRLCDEIGRTPVEVALLWARDHPALDGVILGAVTVVQLEQFRLVMEMKSLSQSERTLVDEFEVGNEQAFDPRYW